MRGFPIIRLVLPLVAALIPLTSCKTVPDGLEQSVGTGAASATAAAATNGDKKLDVLATCRATGAAKGVTWQCPNELVALDMQSDKRDEPSEVALNLEKFGEPFVGMGIAPDNAELIAGAAKLRSVKLAGEKPGAGPVVARMAVVDGTPTRYVSCAAKRDACDDVLRAMVARTPGNH